MKAEQCVLGPLLTIPRLGLMFSLWQSPLHNEVQHSAQTTSSSCGAFPLAWEDHRPSLNDNVTTPNSCQLAIATT